MSNHKQPAPFGLRLPDDLKDWLKQVAAKNRRSATNEIVVRLEESRRMEEAKMQSAQ